MLTFTSGMLTSTLIITKPTNAKLNNPHLILNLYLIKLTTTLLRLTLTLVTLILILTQYPEGNRIVRTHKVLPWMIMYLRASINKGDVQINLHFIFHLFQFDSFSDLYSARTNAECLSNYQQADFFLKITGGGCLAVESHSSQTPTNVNYPISLSATNAMTVSDGWLRPFSCASGLLKLAQRLAASVQVFI